MKTLNKRDKLKVTLAQKELKRRESLTDINILQECFPQQLAFIKSPARRKALCCNRRSGKSFSIALYMIHQALTTPKGKFLYIGLTNESAKGAMWTDIFDIIIRKYHIENLVNFKETALELKFTNGAIIYLRGMDATPKQMNRVRGQKYALIAVDEAQSFTQNLHELINSIADMTLAENSTSVLCMCGTPGSQLGDHYWWKIMRPDTAETEWEKFNWSWEDNTSVNAKTGERVCDNIRKYWEERLVKNPDYINRNEYKREVLGKWVLDLDQMVYKYNDRLNTFCRDAMPLYFYKHPVYLLSIDLGYYDATAFVITSYNKTYDGNLYVIASHKRKNMTISDVVREVRLLNATYHFKAMVIDAANSQAVEEMRQVHSLPFIAAEKQGKEAHIALLNDDFLSNNVRLEASANKDLEIELCNLMWDQKALAGPVPKHKEDGRKDNHLTDALLYAHHYSRHYWFDPSRPTPLDKDRYADMGERLVEMDRKQRGQAQFDSFLNRMFEDKE